MTDDTIQIAVFFGLTALIGLLTWLQCRRPRKSREAEAGAAAENRNYFLAGGSLKWYFVAGSITLTNLSTDQLVGMNGNQMLLIAWWELAAVAGLIILAFVFLPLYYKYQCTTTTQLLEKKLGDKNIRVLIAILFLLGGVLIALPIGLYTGALFLKTMLQTETPLMIIAAALAMIGSAYAIFGGLRAVAVSDTYSGIGLLTLAILLVFLALQKIDFDFSGVPMERLTLIGGSASPIPFSTLFTGMLFIQIFYWCFSQVIVQRALAAPSLGEARKGVLVAAGVRLLIVPVIIAVPGVISYKLYGDIGDAAYGTLVGDILPSWLSGAFAAMMAAAVLTTFNSMLNSGAALYVIDLHPRFFKPTPHIRPLAVAITIGFAAIALFMVPVYADAESIINLMQQLNGVLTMPILSAFLLAIYTRNMAGGAVIAALLFGIALYIFLNTVWIPFGLHYIHLMLVTLIACIGFAFAANKIFYRRTASFSFSTKDDAL